MNRPGNGSSGDEQGHFARPAAVRAVLDVARTKAGALYVPVRRSQRSLWIALDQRRSEDFESSEQQATGHPRTGWCSISSGQRTRSRELKVRSRTTRTDTTITEQSTWKTRGIKPRETTSR